MVYFKRLVLKVISNPTNWPLQMLLGVSIFVGGIWAAVELTDEVFEGDTQTFDVRIIKSMRVAGDFSDPIGSSGIEEMGRDLTALGGVAVLSLITISAISYLLLTRRARTALLVAIAISSGVVVSMLLKYGFDRPRPDLVPHGSNFYTSSFPSGHSMMAALCYFTLAALMASVEEKRRVKIFLLATALVLTVLVGVSRVYMGVHWPTDVLAGWLFGASWATGCLLVAKFLQNRGEIEEEI